VGDWFAAERAQLALHLYSLMLWDSQSQKPCVKARNEAVIVEASVLGVTHTLQTPRASGANAWKAAQAALRSFDVS
jgi:hypothetical protein